MNTITIFSLLFVMISMVQGITLVIKKNRKYNNPPFCFSYTREYDDSDVATSCTGYQFDCYSMETEVRIGNLITFPLTDCKTSAEFRDYTNQDFLDRLAALNELATTLGHA